MIRLPGIRNRRIAQVNPATVHYAWRARRSSQQDGTGPPGLHRETNPRSRGSQSAGHVRSDGSTTTPLLQAVLTLSCRRTQLWSTDDRPLTDFARNSTGMALEVALLLEPLPVEETACPSADARTASARRLGLFVLLALAVVRPSSVGLAQSAPPPLVPWQGLMDQVTPGMASPVLTSDADYDSRAISADGRFVAFESDASDIVNGDWNSIRRRLPSRSHDRHDGAREPGRQWQ